MSLKWRTDVGPCRSSDEQRDVRLTTRDAGTIFDGHHVPSDPLGGDTVRAHVHALDGNDFGPGNLGLECPLLLSVTV